MTPEKIKSKTKAHLKESPLIENKVTERIVEIESEFEHSMQMEGSKFLGGVLLGEIQDTKNAVTGNWGSMKDIEKNVLESKILMKKTKVQVTVETESMTTETLLTKTVQQTPPGLPRDKKIPKIATGPTRKPRDLTAKGRLYNMPSMGNLLNHKKLREGISSEKKALDDHAPDSLKNVTVGRFPTAEDLKNNG